MFVTSCLILVSTRCYRSVFSSSFLPSTITLAGCEQSTPKEKYEQGSSLPLNVNIDVKKILDGTFQELCAERETIHSFDHVSFCCCAMGLKRISVFERNVY